MDEKKAFTGGSSILLAEDDKMNQVVVAGLIKKLNLGRVQIAQNGKEAVQMFCSHPFDLILMDGQMPEMNGIDAALAIRAIEKDKHMSRTPIIALTAHAAQEDKELYLSSGMDDFLIKPLNPDALKQAVQNLVRKKAPHAISPGDADEKPENAPGLKSSDLKDCINVKELKQIMGGKKQLLDKCLQTFEAAYPVQMAELTRCIEKEEYDGLNENAHRLKGMFKYLAAANAVTLIEQLESMGGAQNVTGAHTTVQALHDECLKIIDSIKQILKENFS
ncbi:response regulator [uncultured Desulfobacter sp.]|uniref:response regulator n=1 Tax=uncultured Desulfobacter sp. TaxID=240139 RepID=UPI002AABC7C8|nr:response regulator [uncultured Desulfobacter sp.]